MKLFLQRMSRKTKIVATIGPGSESKENFAKLLHTGVNVARTNMSHDDHTVHTKRIKTIRAVSKKEGIDVAILQDLSGPKIRIGDFTDGPVELVPGKAFILSGAPCEGDSTKVFFNYPDIRACIKIGQVIMLDDGKKKLVVTKIVGEDIYTKVVVGGITKSRRGVNLPGAYLAISALTEKDKKDLILGIELGVDIVALSFVRTAQDIIELRALIKKHKGTQMIVAKIETEEAIAHIDEIIEAADAIMVARGDLAVEVEPERVPAMQKNIIKKCNDAGKPVIVATQMLESMIQAPVPTRAEVSDVANAIFDGADAVMLSEETALGQYAVEAVQTMHNVAVEAEHHLGTHRRYRVHADSRVDSISSSVVHNAEDIHASAIVALTSSGATARMIARYKPQQPIIALTFSYTTARQLLLSYGCYPIIDKKFKDIAQAIRGMHPYLVEKELISKKDIIVLSAGLPWGVAGGTNMLAVLSR
jgi:pyruvate kinase